MDLFRWRDGIEDPFQEFEALQSEINRLFDLSRVPETRGIFDRAFSPAVDLLENPDSFEALCDMPGIEIKDIAISISGNVLTIKGEKKAAETADGTYRGGMKSGVFQRTLQLPLAVDADKVDATLKDGVLRIVLPKHETLKPRQISVKAK
jgi:HSP20 family protein